MVMRTTAQLTDTQIKVIKEIGRHPIGNNLYLRVSKTGRRYFDVRYVATNGKRVWKVIGDQSMPMAVIRRNAAEFIVEKKNNNSLALRFEDAANSYIDRNSEGWNAVHTHQWKQTIEDHCALIKSKRCDAITPEMVAEVLQPIWRKKHETARRIRGRIEMVLNSEMARLGRFWLNPAEVKIQKHLLPKVVQSQQHHEAPHLKALQKLYQGLTNSASNRMLKLICLTLCRTSEIRLLIWSNIKDDRIVFEIDQMKAGKAHSVPMLASMLNAIGSKPKDAKGSVLVFSNDGEPYSLNAMRSVLVKKELPFTVHGIRSTFRDWATGKFPAELAEMQLAHTQSKVVRAYQRTEAIPERLRMMLEWEKTLNEKA